MCSLRFDNVLGWVSIFDSSFWDAEACQTEQANKQTSEWWQTNQATNKPTNESTNQTHIIIIMIIIIKESPTNPPTHQPTNQRTDQLTT